MTGCIILTTLPSMEHSKKIAHGLVKEQIAACVSIIPSIRSIYKWKGKIADEEEFLLLIKTRKEKYNQVESYIKANHPYEVPEVISLEITDTDQEYLKWVFDATSNVKI